MEFLQQAVEQDALDKQDDELADLNLRLQVLMNPATATPSPPLYFLLRLTHSPVAPFLNDDQQYSKRALSP